MTTKDLNLAEMLKNVPQGTKLYSPIFGECELKDVKDNEIIVESDANCGYYTFYEKGSFYKNYGECLLFPSRDNRDWSTFNTEAEGFNVEGLKDKIETIKHILEDSAPEYVSDALREYLHDLEYRQDIARLASLKYLIGKYFKHVINNDSYELIHVLSISVSMRSIVVDRIICTDNDKNININIGHDDAVMVGTYDFESLQELSESEFVEECKRVNDMAVANMQKSMMVYKIKQ